VSGFTVLSSAFLICIELQPNESVLTYLAQVFTCRFLSTQECFSTRSTVSAFRASSFQRSSVERRASTSLQSANRSSAISNPRWDSQRRRSRQADEVEPWYKPSDPFRNLSKPIPPLLFLFIPLRLSFRLSYYREWYVQRALRTALLPVPARLITSRLASWVVSGSMPSFICLDGGIMPWQSR